MKSILLLVSHGNLAQEILNSAKMITGDIENAFALNMSAEEGLQGISNQIKSKIEEYPNHEVLILADLLGGSPFNASVINRGSNEKIQIVTGMNLNMVVEYSVSQINDVKELANHLSLIGTQGIQIYEEETDDDEIDF